MERKKIISANLNFAVASQPCPLGHITKDKKLCYAWPKLPSATSFISNVLIKFCNMEEIK